MLERRHVEVLTEVSSQRDVRVKITLPVVRQI